jgi:hypothetical protein
LGSSHPLPVANATIIHGFQGETVFEGQDRCPAQFIPGGLLKMFMKTLFWNDASAVVRWE